MVAGHQFYMTVLDINRNQRTCKAAVNETNVLQDFDENIRDTHGSDGFFGSILHHIFDDI